MVTRVEVGAAQSISLAAALEAQADIREEDPAGLLKNFK